MAIRYDNVSIMHTCNSGLMQLLKGRKAISNNIVTGYKFRGVGSFSILGPRVLKIMQYHIVDKKHLSYLFCACFAIKYVCF